MVKNGQTVGLLNTYDKPSVVNRLNYTLVSYSFKDSSFQTIRKFKQGEEETSYGFDFSYL